MEKITTLRIAALAASGLAAAGCGGRAVEVLDARRADYTDNEGAGRILAEVRAELQRADPDRARLVLRLSAVGALVDPVPGFEGVRGENRITARELTRLVERGELRVETRPRAGGEPISGSYEPGRRGRVAQRRTSPGGAIDVNGFTDEEYVLEVHADTGPLEPGRYDTYVIVGRMPRLRVEIAVGPDASRIEAIAPIGGEDIER